MSGTGLFAPSGAAMEIAITDESNNAMIAKGTAANIAAATGAGYAVGCWAYATDSGAWYQNVGTVSVASWSAVGTGTLTIPAALTDSTSTTTTSLALTQNAVTTGAGLTQSLNGLTTGKGLSLTHTTSVISGGGTLLNLSSTGADTTTTSGALLNLSATSGVAATQFLSTFATTTGIGESIVVNALTTGQALSIVSTSTGITSGSLLSISTGTTGAVATNGVVSIVATGNYTSTSNVGLLSIVANSTTAGTVCDIFANALTTGVAKLISGTGAYTGTGFHTINASGATTGIISLIKATAATLTTGRYLSANDITTGEVFGIGTNGHIISTVSASAASAASTVAQGITAAAIVANSTDTAGGFTTTGTQNNTTDSTITVTFGKTYTTAPKAVILTAANAAGASGQVYISSITATTFVVGFAKSATWAATPAYNYIVIA